MKPLNVILTAIIALGVLSPLGCKKPVVPVDLEMEADARPRVNETPAWLETIAVVDTKFTRSTSRDINTGIDYQTVITEKIERAFLNTGRYQTVERARLHSMKDEIILNRDSEWFDQGRVNEAGRFLSAKYLILPTAKLEVGVLASRLELQVKVVDTETGVIVKSFELGNTSTSLSINNSVTVAMKDIEPKLSKAIAAHFPARAAIVAVKGNDLWAEMNATVFVKKGMRMRILRAETLYNPLRKTYGVFLSEKGWARIDSVTSTGIIARLKSGKKPQVGDVLEVVND